jgi:CubicO group peptidase (beta-lactamase class C family)
MDWSSLRNSPVVATVLGAVVTGAGHVYLRRYLRALGWLTLAVTTGVLFVPESALLALAAGEVADPVAVAPVLVVSVVSVFDAYVLARGGLDTDQGQSQASGADTNDDGTVDCPSCGKEVDPGVGFCHWCTTEFTRDADGTLRGDGD